MSSDWWKACSRCGVSAQGDSSCVACGICGGPIAVVYSNTRSVTEGTGVFRHAALLPVADASRGISMGEGDTPILEIEAALTPHGPRPASVLLKCEFLNPTGSFKDRIAAVAVTIALERGLSGCVGTSSGNGGAAVAAYAARAGVPLTLFVAPGAPTSKLAQIRAFGPRVVELHGLGWEAAATEAAAKRIAQLADDRNLLAFVTARRFNREAMEGAKTIAYELVEQAPEATVIYVPVGGGGLLSAIWRGYQESAGRIPSLPRLVAVQPSGCATVKRALDRIPAALDDDVTTAVSGLQMGVLFDAIDVVDALEGSSGHLVEVSDDEIWMVQSKLALEEGILVEPAGATALAGLVADMSTGRVGSEDIAVLVATGAGYKDGAALQRLALERPLEDVAIDELDRLL